jgi:branched-chain amino acid transport system substrate-binding protein
MEGLNMSRKYELSRPNRRTVLTTALGGIAAMSSMSARAAGPTVKVGAIMPSSGVLAFPGQACVRGINLGATLATERLGVSLEVIHADTQSKPENGRIAAESLIRQGCTILIGAWDSGATISALQACEAAKVPMVVHIASATQVTSQGFTQVFRFYPTANNIVRQGLQEFKSFMSTLQDPPKSFALIHLNNTMGTSTATNIDSVWTELNMPMKIVERVPYDERARDLAVEVAKAKASGADALLSVTRVNDAVMIVKECVRQGWSPKMIASPNSNGVSDKAFYDGLGKYADDSMSGIVWYNPSNPQTKTILERFEKAYPNEWLDANSGCAIEAVQIVADAIVRAKSANSAEIHAALKATNLAPIVMYGGNIQFDETGQNINSGVVLLQARDGKPVVVSPEKVAAAKPRYPLGPFDKR